MTVPEKRYKVKSPRLKLAVDNNASSDPGTRARLQEKWLSLEQSAALPSLFWRLGVPTQEVADLISETAYQACRSIGTLRSWDDFDKWVVGIARNVYYRYRRDLALRIRRENRAIESMFTLEGVRIDEAVGNRTMIENCLGKLNELDRRIVVLRALYGYNWEKISELVGKPRSSVARYYEAAIEKLRKCLS